MSICEEQLGNSERAVIHIRIAAMLIVLFAFVGEVHAQNSADSERIRFDIPTQPLETALAAFGERSRFQILYETALTAGRRSHGVEGVLTHAEALRQLLTGTGLEFNYTDDRSFTVVPILKMAAKSPVANYNWFLGDVQVNVLAALCSSPETRPGDFHMAIQFWIGSSGRVEKPRLLGTTGMDRRDTAIAAALRTLAFNRLPPSDMPQPITMVLQPGPEDAHDECASRRP